MEMPYLLEQHCHCQILHIVQQEQEQKTVIARPLTKLPGNTRGTRPPGGDPNIPLGWKHVLVIDGPHPTNWVRAHLVNENLHGPGQDWNLVPGTQLLNSNMRDGAEKWAKMKLIKMKSFIIKQK